jgi:hypothetical protein
VEISTEFSNGSMAALNNATGEAISLRLTVLVRHLVDGSLTARSA